jgi:predicted helicase
MMSDKNAFDRYLLALRKTPLDDKTEHTDRAALQSLLQTVADEAAKGVAVSHEPKRVVGKGAPDFKVTRKGLILGYVENKGVGENLDKVLKSDQIKRYKELSDNIILTDYLHFIWIGRNGVQRETLCHPTDLETPRFRLREDRVASVGKLLQGFFSAPPADIDRAQQLALALATRSKLLRDYLGEELVRQQREHTKGRLYGLFDVFKKQVFHELTLNEFADAFAQMLAYGLFLARLNSDGKTVTLHNAREYVPGSFRLIRELVDFLAELEKDEYREVRWVVEEVLSIVNGLDLPAIQEDLSFRQRKAISRKVRAADEEEHRLFERDPFIYFYEDYLKAYDPAMRKSRGVYYTPPPIVNFIVRAVDDILKESFGIRDGLADHKRVTVLDFACGTGTFLLEVFQRIFDNIGGPRVGRADLIVRDHFLKHLFGFEYLIAPYTIAHLKLSQYIKDQEHSIEDGERLQVYLTNTLEPVEPQKHLLLPEVTAEGEAAQAVKEKAILVITGNPHYSGHSKNKGAWITAQIGRYREGFPELSKPAQGKWLQDDYVKFIRFAQMKMDGGEFEFKRERGNVQTIRMEGVEQGIVGIITNHSWLDNPTFKGMRKSLMESFNQIYVLDLHGNSKKKERAPDGGDDQNVFDIEQGVGISLFVKGRDLERGVWHSDLWGKRLAKYAAAVAATKASIAWTRLEPDAPDWLFKPQDTCLRHRYREFWSIPAIFAPMGDPAPGIVTTHDDFAVSFTAGDAQEKVRALLSTADEREARRLFRLCSQDQWSYDTAKVELRSFDLSAASAQLSYRPFDTRWTIWNSNVAVHRRERVMRHMLGENIAITTSRQAGVIGSPEFDAVMVVNRPVDFNFYRRGGEYVFPAYLLSLQETTGRGGNAARQENLSSDFRAFLDARYDHPYTPEEILGYIYSVLHAQTYRRRYAEFLRIDFPRVPFPEAAKHFETLSLLGWALVQAHLLREVPRRNLATYQGKGDHSVEAVRYVPADEAIAINKTQFFKPVPQAVWEFHIGGYQVLDKYLKSRKGRVLSLDEINQVGAIADSLAFTVEQMARIDEAYRAAFPDRG